MVIYAIDNGKIRTIEATSFQGQGMLERRDIQRLLHDSIEILIPGAMVLTEEFSDWSDSRRRIDLLCLRKNGDLAVVELKRTEDGGHMELQAVRYAAMVSKMTYQQAVRVHQQYLESRGREENAEQRILEFLDWEEPMQEQFAQNVSIVLAAAEFSKELTTAVMWLNEFDLDIVCIRLKPHKLDGKILLNVEQIIPLPEASEYQVRMREKEKEERSARTQDRDMTRFDLRIGNAKHTNLPKRQLAYLIIRTAIETGAAPSDVLPLGRNWIIVDGEVSEDEFETAALRNRTEDSSSSEFRRFFTADDQLFRHNGKTFALTKMWGARTLETVDQIIKKYRLTDIKYEPSNIMGE